MDFLTSIALYLESLGIGSASGSNVNIFVGKQPPEPNNCITVLGLIGNELPDATIADLNYPRFQVLIRNIDYEDGSEKLRQVREALHTAIALNLPNYHVLRLHAQQEGYPIGEDEQGRPEFSINFYGEARYVDS